MQKFYLKLEKQKRTATGGPGGNMNVCGDGSWERSDGCSISGQLWATGSVSPQASTRVGGIFQEAKYRTA